MSYLAGVLVASCPGQAFASPVKLSSAILACKVELCDFIRSLRFVVGSCELCTVGFQGVKVFAIEGPFSHQRGWNKGFGIGWPV